MIRGRGSETGTGTRGQGTMNEDIKNCADLDERLAPYVDGEQHESRPAVEAHLAACPPCRNHADAESAARTIVHDHLHSLSARASDTLRVRCAAIANRQSSIHSPIANRQSAVRRWAPLSLAATLVLAVAGAFVFGLNDRVEALASSLVIDHVKCFAMPGNASQADLAHSAARWQQDQGW